MISEVKSAQFLRMRPRAVLAVHLLKEQFTEDGMDGPAIGGRIEVAEVDLVESFAVTHRGFIALTLHINVLSTMNCRALLCWRTVDKAGITDSELRHCCLRSAFA